MPESCRAPGAVWSVWIARAGGLGLLRPGPGTWGSAGAVLPVLACVWIWPQAVPWFVAPLALLALVLGLLSAGRAAAVLGSEDPGEIVIDEVAGTLLALAVLPPGLLLARPVEAVALALCLFRVFDIAKPWPVGAVERLPGAVGIMADDLLAGLLAGVLCTAVLA